MAHPQLSIVIPAYNESARIEDALERVLNCVAEQQWDAEVLVVDDGSRTIRRRLWRSGWRRIRGCT
jgi:glycosyltransferase involved in cell wall biosynthesis